jgi:hypothetical protein
MRVKKLPVLIAATMLLFSGAAQAKELVIGLSPLLEEKSAETQGKEILQFLTHSLEPGDKAMIFDAWNLQSLGTFAVPEGSAYRGEKARLNHNRALVAKLLQMGHEARPVGISGGVKLPQFLQFLGQNYGPLENADIIILGSPLYIDPALPEQSMTGGKVPGDGYFSATPDKSPFSIKGKEKLLTGSRLHMGFSSRDLAPGSAHDYAVKRFWTLFIEGHGAVLSSFTGDKTTLWNRVKNQAGALPHDFVRQETDKLEMMVIDLPKEGSFSIFERALSSARPDANLLSAAHDIEIGISWDCKSCDIDLHTRPAPHAKILNFMTTESPEGLYRKDFRQSPQTSGGFETISFKVPVDLNAMLIALNWYDGISDSGVRGEIRLSVNGETWARPFRFSSRRGNGGKDFQETVANEIPANDGWLVIEPRHILVLE